MSNEFFNLYVINRDIDLLVIAFGTSIWFTLAIGKRTAKFVITAIYGGLIVIILPSTGKGVQKPTVQTQSIHQLKSAHI
jgi:hypothetical protein